MAPLLLLALGALSAACADGDGTTDIGVLALERPVVSGENYYAYDAIRGEVLVLTTALGRLGEVRHRFEGSVGALKPLPQGGVAFLTRSPDALVILGEEGDVARVFDLDDEPPSARTASSTPSAMVGLIGAFDQRPPRRRSPRR